MSGFPVVPPGGLSVYGAGQWGDFTMDPVAQTTPPQPTHTQALNQAAATAYTQLGQSITYNYYTNCDTYWHNLTINAGCAFYTAGDRLFIAGTLNLNGIIDFGATSPNGQQSLSSTSNTFAGGAGGATDPLGQAISPSANGVGAGAIGVLPAQGSGMQSSIRMGGASGAGGAGAGGAGGGGRGASASWVESAGLPFALVNAMGYHIGPTGLTQYLPGSSGGNGAGDGGANAGCFGGAGGGVVVVMAQTIVGSGTIASSGGNGGSIATTNVGGGGGGAGGILIVVTKSAVWNGTAYTIPGITTSAPGGLHGTGGGGSGLNGVDGTAGTVIIMPG